MEQAIYDLLGLSGGEADRSWVHEGEASIAGQRLAIKESIEVVRVAVGKEDVGEINGVAY